MLTITINAVQKVTVGNVGNAFKRMLNSKRLASHRWIPSTKSASHLSIVQRATDTRQKVLPLCQSDCHIKTLRWFHLRINKISIFITTRWMSRRNVVRVFFFCDLWRNLLACGGQTHHLHTCIKARASATQMPGRGFFSYSFSSWLVEVSHSYSSQYI